MIEGELWVSGVFAAKIATIVPDRAAGAGFTQVKIRFPHATVWFVSLIAVTGFSPLIKYLVDISSPGVQHGRTNPISVGFVGQDDTKQRSAPADAFIKMSDFVWPFFAPKHSREKAFEPVRLRQFGKSIPCLGIRRMLGGTCMKFDTFRFDAYCEKGRLRVDSARVGIEEADKDLGHAFSA